MQFQAGQRCAGGEKPVLWVAPKPRRWQQACKGSRGGRIKSRQTGFEKPQSWSTEEQKLGVRLRTWQGRRVTPWSRGSTEKLNVLAAMLPCLGSPTGPEECSGAGGRRRRYGMLLRAFIFRWDRYQSGFDFNHAMPIPAIVTYQIWIHQLLQQPPFVWWEQIINGPIFVHQRGRGAGGGLYPFWHIGDIKCDDRVHWLFSHYMITHQDLSAITTWQGRHQKQLSFP